VAHSCVPPRNQRTAQVTALPGGGGGPYPPPPPPIPRYSRVLPKLSLIPSSVENISRRPWPALGRSATGKSGIPSLLRKQKFHNHTHKNQRSKCLGYFYCLCKFISASVLSVLSFHSSEVGYFSQWFWTGLKSRMTNRRKSSCQYNLLSLPEIVDTCFLLFSE
jgi:hypothetical protein